MDHSSDEIAFLVFDIETVADGNLISKIQYADESLDPAEAIRRYRQKLLEEKGSDVVPWTYVLPAAVAVAKVDASFRLRDLTVLDAPDYRPYEITRRFWQGWLHYQRPTFVTFNGRGYDLPVMEMAAFRYGISLPAWFNISARSYEQSRNRYNSQTHLDLMDVFSNFGAARVSGGLNLLANLLGKPGKTTIDGSMVQDMYFEGRVEEINDYCRCDVLDTYFVFLRSRVLTGQLTIDEEQTLVADTKAWLEAQRSESPAIDHYLNHWGDWTPSGE